MISDGVHSVLDVISIFVFIASIHFANQKADKKHPYGHERMESVASLLLAIFY